MDLHGRQITAPDGLRAMARGCVRTDWPIAAGAGFGLAILVLVCGFAIVDRTGLWRLVKPIEARFHHFVTPIGWLQGAAVAIVKGPQGGPLGALADPAGRQAQIALEIAAGRIAATAFGLVGGIAGLLIVRIVVGIEKAAPALPRASADRWVVLWV